MEKSFAQWKKQSLNKADLSKKGAVDEAIEPVVSLLNSREEYFTTSSCSGRVILIDGAADSSAVQKLNCAWLFVSHHKCTSEDLLSALAGCSGDAVLKFEPFVLHVQCRRLEDAQLMHSVAIDSGFRNSGLTVGKTGKIITGLHRRKSGSEVAVIGGRLKAIKAVRSTHGLEVPLSHDGTLLIPQEYITYLTQVANQKMEENHRRISRFYQNLHSALLTEKPQTSQIQDPQDAPETEKGTDEEEEKEERKKTSVYKRRRKREQRETGGCHGDGDCSVPGLEDCLDLFT